MLCDALFYNKKAYDNHNLHHSPDDLYLDSELDRKTAVARVDCDFDLTRVPTMWEKIHGHKKPRVKRIQQIEPDNLVVPTSESASPTNPSTSSVNPSVSSSVSEVVPSEESVEEKMGRNRAMVDSDSDCKSDTSDESDQETNQSTSTTSKKSSPEPKEKRRK
ncbi:uncharacterized protein LOC111707947 [Eurytemora carolleeae]|uniref:uncharacterized protein LOC111707947 n=1 Tax=Eurytemora carolleeae TaxID=1294199 RepID=UPI000C775C73|nr:uncharacterized protein LOC111707947 [Eurytemora carolleeae]|eukprot:XP_023336911.1 uncharacterized protein LOC111707947 [Eurytemora affinis]